MWNHKRSRYSPSLTGCSAAQQQWSISWEGQEVEWKDDKTVFEKNEDSGSEFAF